MKGVINYFQEVRLEISKVVWPKKEQVIRLTLIVFAISAIIGLYVGVLDLIMTKSLTFLLEK